MSSRLDYTDLQSKVIDFLRFPLIVGVLFIHNSGVKEIVQQNRNLSTATNVVNLIVDLFSNTLAAVAVPIFFFISGFLFFYKSENFTFEIYKTKLVKRVKTLLIPYLFWNLLFVITCILASRISILSSFFNS
ncbi:MAG: acyltransferase family protein, partial [Muribaculaceae bacterium]|nr:acyltransferase family protein [Muribaculaceae bacterium]